MRQYLRIHLNGGDLFTGTPASDLAFGRSVVPIINAMGTQTKIARTIREQDAHYVLCVKDNHPKLLDSIMFAGIDPKGPLTPSSTHETKNPGHGRSEIRRCWAFDATDRLYKAEEWQDLASFAVISGSKSKRLLFRLMLFNTSDLKTL